MHKYMISIFLFTILFLTSFSCIYGKFEDISEKTAIVLDSDGLSILYDKSSNMKIYPASTTKILTAILAIENLNIDSNITVSSKAISSVPVGSSIMYLMPGEVLTARQLLYGLLLPSGNDAAIVLAEAVSGSVTNFAILMNKKLEELGCRNSHFVNPHGFHDNNHYSTAYDMAIIMKYASQNEIFRNICETKEYIINETNKTLTPRKLINTNLLLSENLEYVLGGKTGYTEEAGNVFVCYSSFNGNKIICSVFDGLKNVMSKKTRFIDTKMLLDNTFENFEKTKILNKETVKTSYIDKKTDKSYILGIDDDIYCLTDKNGYVIHYNLSDITINEEDINGNISVNAKNENWKFDNTYKLQLIETKSYNGKLTDSNFILLIICFVLLVIIIILLNIKNKIKKV